MSELERPLKNFLRTPDSAARADAMWQNISARRGRRILSWRPLAGVALACACALVFVALRNPTAGLRVRAGAGAGGQGAVAAHADAGPLRLADGSALAVPRTDAPTGTHLKLSDGSQIELAMGSELVSRGSSGSHVAFALLHGHALFDVMPHGPRRWVITAGEVEVSVLGTRFTVERGASEVRVTVERGAVRVAGSLVPGGAQELRPGQALRVPVSELHVQQEAPAAPASVSPAASSADAGVHAGARPAQKLAAAGFRTAVQDAENADELLALADSARVSGQVKNADLALSRLLDHYADDPHAALAALTLGRIRLDQLHDPAQAALAFEQANALGLPRALAEEGAARVVEAHVKAGHMALAQIAAARYRARFAGGRRSADVAAWVRVE
jgi:transmembrane sensor